MLTTYAGQLGLLVIIYRIHSPGFGDGARAAASQLRKTKIQLGLELGVCDRTWPDKGVVKVIITVTRATRQLDAMARAAGHGQRNRVRYWTAHTLGNRGQHGAPRGVADMSRLCQSAVFRGTRDLGWPRTPVHTWMVMCWVMACCRASILRGQCPIPDSVGRANHGNAACWFASGGLGRGLLSSRAPGKATGWPGV